MKAHWLIFSVLILSAFFTGCGDEVQAGNDDDPLISSCTGFGAAEINVFVIDSLNENVLIEDAIVRVISTSGDVSLEENALYISSDDALVNTLPGAYYSLLNLNSNQFEVSIVVLSDGYHSFVTKGIEFEIDTSCGASNSINYTVYLCPEGTACL